MLDYKDGFYLKKKVYQRKLLLQTFILQTGKSCSEHQSKASVQEVVATAQCLNQVNNFTEQNSVFVQQYDDDDSQVTKKKNNVKKWFKTSRRGDKTAASALMILIRQMSIQSAKLLARGPL